MKTPIAAAIFILSASAAMAEAPCQNPVASDCQKACAMIGAKYILLMREQSLQPGAHFQMVRAEEPADNPGSLENAQRLARIAGLTLDYIDGMTWPQSKATVAAYCPR